MAYKNREDALAQYRKYYVDNRERLKEAARVYRHDPNNKEKISSNKKRYHSENRQRIQEARHLNYLKNRDKIRKRNAEYGRSPAGRRAARASYSKRRGAPGSFTAEDIRNLYATQGARCYYCSVSIEEKYHIDHMTPIKRGGSNWVDNLCLACVPCNLRKHTKTAEEFQRRT